jgi:hypothetical protein
MDVKLGLLHPDGGTETEGSGDKLLRSTFELKRQYVLWHRDPL